MSGQKGIKALIFLFLFLAAAGLFSACSPKGRTTAQDATTSGSQWGESDLDFQRENRFGEGNIPLAESEGMFKNIPFDFDASTISDLARQNLEYNAELLRRNPEILVQLEGHCDERGTSEYNLALGQRRAQAVADFLTAYGISSDRLSTISFGEEVPLDPRATEEAWTKNRRVHFSAYTSRR